MTQKRGRALKTPLIAGVALGAAFGLFFRLLAELPAVRSFSSASIVMTVAFLALGSMAIGAITIERAESAGPRHPGVWIVLPWLPLSLSAAIAYLLNLEGLICVVFAFPIGCVFASIGGVVAGSLARRRGNRRALPMACMAILPLVLAPLESRLSSPVEHRTVETEIRIQAPAEVVWRNIERVPPIAPEELRPTWTQWIGFPRPIEATLSFEGVGGVRHASFEHGLLFVETVTRWEPEKVLSFSIRADTAHIPPHTLDEHVSIGGRYFDVLEGEYRIELMPDGGVKLHLSSEERLSTDFNGYAGWWSDAVMKSLQESILGVIQRRCEGAGVLQTSEAGER